MPIRASGLSKDASSRAYVHDRVGFKMGRFAEHIHMLEIRLKNQCGALGETLIACSLFIALDAGEPVVVERVAPQAREAFDHALGVAARSIQLKIQRQRHR